VFEPGYSADETVVEVGADYQNWEDFESDFIVVCPK